MAEGRRVLGQCRTDGARGPFLLLPTLGPTQARQGSLWGRQAPPNGMRGVRAPRVSVHRDRRALRREVQLLHTVLTTLFAQQQGVAPRYQRDTSRRVVDMQHRGVSE